MKRAAIALVVGCALVLSASTVLAMTWYVNAQGTGDAKTIQAAINQAAPGDTVLLDPGVYTGEGNKNIDYLGKAIVVRVGVRGGAMIDCEGDGRGFDFANGETNDAILEGVVIINGYVPPAGGGAIRCQLGSSPTIMDCVMRDNQAECGGAFECCQSSPQITGCRFINNSATTLGSGGAMSIHTESEPTISYCWFEKNSAHYTGGIEILDSDPNISYTTMIENTCNAMGGAIGAQFGDFRLDHCTLDRNASADSAGGIFLYQSAPRIQCTLITFCPSGAAIWCFMDCSDPLVLATDIFGNADGDWISCVGGFFPGYGNRNVDPLYCDVPIKDYHLYDCSPVVGLGQPCGPHWGAWDVGCSCEVTDVQDVDAVESHSWGTIKKLYR